VATLENVSGISVTRRRDNRSTGNDRAESFVLQRISPPTALSDVVRAARIFFCQWLYFRVACGLTWHHYWPILCAHS